MLLIVKKPDNSVETYKIHEPEDLMQLAEHYPFVESIINNSEHLEDAVNKVAAYLNRSHVNAIVEESLSKSVRAKAATLGLIAGLMAHGGTKQISSMASLIPPGRLVAPAQERFGKKNVDNFLWAIMQIETSGGKNLNHPTIESGPMKGQKAVGRWALLHPTVVDFSKRLAAQGKLTPDMQRAAELDRDRLHVFFQKHPYTELKFARAIANHVLDKHNGDIQKAAYSWLHGHNISSENISQDMLQNSDYVNKFNKHYSKAPFKMPKATMIAKSDRAPDKTNYKNRYKTWKEKQESRKRNNFSDRINSNDYGRRIEPELDQANKIPENSIEKLKQGLRTK